MVLSTGRQRVGIMMNGRKRVVLSLLGSRVGRMRSSR